MSDLRQPAEELFGTNLVAMATPMHPGGDLSMSDVGSLVDHLLATGCDGIVVAGTTGESPTLTEAETTALVQVVKARAGNRAKVVVGVGTYDTAATVRRAQDAEGAGADALLLVCPYYSLPTQAGVIAHGLTVADATALPVMLYDVPARTGTPMDATSIVELAAHPNIRAIKDAKGDLFEAMSIMERTTLAYYCGIDELNLAYLACGAAGVLSVVGNVAADRTAALIAAVRVGDLESARKIQTSLIALTDAIMRTSQGAIMVKAALVQLGIITHPTVRLPLVESPTADLDKLNAVLTLPAICA